MPFKGVVGRRSGTKTNEGYQDLRDWLELVEAMGELRRVDGADPHLEIGAIAEIVQRQPGGPAVLFDKIVGLEPGFRMLLNPVGSVARTSLTAHLPVGLGKLDYVALWRRRRAELRPLAPRFVSSGPVMENVLTGSDVNLNLFPSPLWHERDGGCYVGTGSINITADPDDGWVNLGCYRLMSLDERRIFVYASPGRHGRIHAEKRFARQLPCPVVVSLGHDPLLFQVGFMDVPFGTSEYGYAGAIRGEPIEVIEGPITGLPIPARAEVVLEGEIRPGYVGREGPFGEFTGYYGSGAREEPIMDVQAVYYRTNPIVLGHAPTKPPNAAATSLSMIRSGVIWEQLERAGVPDVTGVWCHEVGSARMLIAVSIKQRYAGHARQAGHVLAFSGAGAYLGRYAVVVDDDIDVSDLNEVMWAVCTRTDPIHSIDFAERCWSGPLDPAIPPHQKGLSSRAIIDACRPYEWRDKFPAVVEVDRERKLAALAKWRNVLFPGT